VKNKTGRNDPCPCGSGKKYKHCHLGQKFEYEPAEHPALAEAATPYDPIKLAEVLRQSSARLSPKKRAEAERFIAEAGYYAEYLKHRDSIQAATQKLDACHEEFVQWGKNLNVYFLQTQTLFAEDPFVPLRFTAEEVRRACVKSGFKSPKLENLKRVGTHDEILQEIADPSRRRSLAIRLLMILPSYVDANRLMDGWIIYIWAMELAKTKPEKNLFLFCMFARGYEAWMEAHDARRKELAQSAGIDFDCLNAENLDEIDSWSISELEPSVLQAKLETFLAAHPNLKAQTTEEKQRTEQAAINLLCRTDAYELRLPPKETEAFLPELNEVYTQWLGKNPGLTIEDGFAKEHIGGLGELLFGLSSKMVKALFTPEGLQQYLGRLKKFRDDQGSAGNAEAAQAAGSAIIVLEREHNPANNRFLNLLCVVSISKLFPATGPANEPMNATPDTAPAAGNPATTTEAE
jgi:hypothetical protein